MNLHIALAFSLFLPVASLAQSERMADSLAAVLEGMPNDTVSIQRLVDMQYGPLASELKVLVNERLGELVELLRKDADPAVRARAELARLDVLYMAAVARSARLDLSGALRLLDEIRLLNERYDDPNWHRWLLDLYPWIYREAGDTAREKAALKERFAIALERGDTTTMINTYEGLLMRAGPEEVDLALATIERYAGGLEGSGQLFALFTKGSLQRSHKRWSDALTTFKRCEDLAAFEGMDPYSRASYLCWLGSAYQMLDSFPQAIRAYEACRDHSAMNMVAGWECTCADSLGIVHAILGNTSAAESSWRRSIRVGLANGYTDEVALAAGLLKDLLAREGRAAEALEVTNIWITARDSLMRTNAKTDLMRMEFREAQHVDSLMNLRDRAEERTIADGELRRERTRRNILIFSGIGLLIFGVVVYRQRNRISRERKRSDELLLNILPEEVAEELKDTGAAQAKHFDQATILFTDFKGFTGISERMSAADLVDELNTCFKAFDHIITARGIEKIKTIGDAYMCAGGLPDPKSSSPQDVVHAALEMQAFMIARKKERDAQAKPAFEMRVGIHTGPVVAGIVGVKKFAYDIWGDTVNIASRMESSGEVGQVNISEATYALIREQAGSLFHFTPRGKVQAKGKGEMEMYFVRRSLGEGVDFVERA